MKSFWCLCTLHSWSQLQTWLWCMKYYINRQTMEGESQREASEREPRSHWSLSQAHALRPAILAASSAPPLSAQISPLWGLFWPPWQNIALSPSAAHPFTHPRFSHTICHQLIKHCTFYLLLPVCLLHWGQNSRGQVCVFALFTHLSLASRTQSGREEVPEIFGMNE